METLLSSTPLIPIPERFAGFPESMRDYLSYEDLSPELWTAEEAEWESTFFCRNGHALRTAITERFYAEHPEYAP